MRCDDAGRKWDSAGYIQDTEKTEWLFNKLNEQIQLKQKDVVFFWHILLHKFMLFWAAYLFRFLKIK